MTDVELVFDFVLPKFERNKEDDNEGLDFDFTLPDVNPTEYTFKTLSFYLLGQFGWFSVIFMEYWSIGSFEAGVALVIWFVIFSATRIKTWTQIEWYSRILLVLNWGTTISTYLLFFVLTLLA